MKSLLNQVTDTPPNPDLGREIISWIYKSERSNRFLYSIIAVLATGLFLLWPMAKDFLPFLKHIPAIALYLVILVGARFLKSLTNSSRDQEWALFEKGFRVRFLSRDGVGETRAGYWKKYRTCTFSDKGIKLIPEQAFTRGERIPVRVNVMGIYSIVRERISMEHAHELEKASPFPSQSRSAEHRQIQRRINVREFKPVKGAWSNERKPT